MNRILNNKAQAVVSALTERGLTVATAESCTGGMLSGALTAVAGASAVLQLGAVTYSCRMKNRLLGVSQEILDTFGAVSAETAAEMARGVRKLAGSDIGISVTGVAGPSTSEGKPVGTVFLGLSDCCGTLIQPLNLGEDSRNIIRIRACTEALDMILIHLERNVSVDSK